jgi:hypothetical protein
MGIIWYNISRGVFMIEEKGKYLSINEITGEATKNTKTGAKKRTRTTTKEQLRKLTQYRDLTDAQFDEVWAKRDVGISHNKLYEERIKVKIDEMKAEYDFSDLKPNDWNQIRSLAQLQIDLEDLNLMLFAARTKKNSAGETVFDAIEYKTLSQVRDSLVDRISSVQNDLQITRRVRRNDQATSVMDEITKLKEKINHFAEHKTKKLICPKCNRWIGQLYLLFWNAPKTKIQIQCQSDMEDGSKCGEILTFTGKDLAEMGSSNRPELLPITLR